MNEVYEEAYDYETPAEYAPAPPLDTLTADELSEYRFRRARSVVEGLLSPGLAVLAGSPKVGKSWLVLQLCLKVAKGEPFWGMPTVQSEVLYFALEDSPLRLQKRLLTLPEEASPHLHCALGCRPLAAGFEDQLNEFINAYPGTRLVVVDTFQKIRGEVSQMSYANDYSEVSRLKALADRLNLCLLLVHHTRKMSDSDALNEISGTNGIAGSADTLMVLKKEKRTDSNASLTCTGRDIEDRELRLRMNRTSCLWEVTGDSLHRNPAEPMPELMLRLVSFMKKIEKFGGSNKAFSDAFAAYLRVPVDTAFLKRQMNRWRYELEDRGVSFFSHRTSDTRCVVACYSAKQDTTLSRPDDAASAPDDR